jgi:hypothetical protein
MRTLRLLKLLDMVEEGPFRAFSDQAARKAYGRPALLRVTRKATQGSIVRLNGHTSGEHGNAEGSAPPQ